MGLLEVDEPERQRVVGSRLLQCRRLRSSFGSKKKQTMFYAGSGGYAEHSTDRRMSGQQQTSMVVVNKAEPEATL